uniref:Uncharacterized protein n=1 Tax=Glossina austeni TaxID=7395 RepID=A0A1A9UYN0_GLOAU
MKRNKTIFATSFGITKIIDPDYNDDDDDDDDDDGDDDDDEKMELCTDMFHNTQSPVMDIGTYTNKIGQTFPIAARMREVIWDNELEFMMQTWARAGKEVPSVDCIGSQRLNFVYAKMMRPWSYIPRTLIKYQIQEKCKVTGARK